MGDGRNLRFTLAIDGEEVLSHRVVRFELEEGLSEGSRGWVELESEEALDATELPGKPVRLGISFGNGLPDRAFHGVILGTRMEAFQPDHFRLRLEVGARLHLLELGQEVRLFQNQTVPEVVKEVLAQAGIPKDAQSWPLESSYPKYDALTQYNESDWAFLRRLLAREGIAFVVRNDVDAEKFVFFDGSDGLAPVEGELVLMDRASTSTAEDTVLRIQERRAAASDSVMVRDYDPRRPTVNLSHTEKAEGSRGREVYLHPGGFEELAEGKRLAKRAVERLQVDTHLREGTTDCPFLEPGRTVAMEGHLRLELNGQMLLLSVVHRGGLLQGEPGTFEQTYENSFRAIPHDTPFRPPLPPEPRTPGVQVAFVTGPSGQELHGNEHGEVRVRFPWDRSGIQDDRSSPWLRVGQVALGGSMIIPRVGFEVLVDHELGTWDRPLVTGHLYNGEAQPPYALPDHATLSSLQTATTDGGPGANELRFEDAAGAEEIFLNASHDLTVSVEHDASMRVLVDEAAQVSGNRTFSVGANLTEQITSDRTLQVGANQSLSVGADLSEAVGGSSTVTVGAARKLTVGGDLSENTQGALNRSVGGLQSLTGIAGYDRKVVGGVKTSVGAAWLEVCAKSRSTTCGPTRVETVGALKMVKAKTVAVSCGTAYVMNAAAETVKCGGDRTDKAGAALALSAGGGLSVKANNINITGESKVVLRVGGSVLEVTPTGVRIKSSDVKLEGVKKLGSTIGHESN
ncbi:type VI secretion system Vgr family protein [Hyalangium versicolor]|uniref:type VI secretion system Vgr family protein n=1 Tax=Hyalangium versicolor TaxID=2861190 RepID=UPI001CC9321A|nr:type VI secretion system tip protein TssI/VgrG [Hyalangium versicolor]